MNALRQSQINGEPVRRRPRLAAEYDDGLYRYVPVPPVFRDAEGYPLEDGMSQNENHQKETAYWCDVLQRHLPGAMVCSDLPMPYWPGDGNRTVVPDLLVALRAPPVGNRTSYKLWENPLPDLAMEMLSPGNWRDDDGPKRRTYQHLGVREYWQFDLGGHLSAPLVGYRLGSAEQRQRRAAPRKGQSRRRYRRIRANAAGRLPSKVLDLELHVRDGRLRFHDPATGEDLLTSAEQAERAEAAERRADAAERRADAAERELARLRLRQDG